MALSYYQTREEGDEKDQGQNGYGNGIPATAPPATCAQGRDRRTTIYRPDGRDGRGGSHGARPFCRRTMAMKTGAPIMAVTMPASISAGRPATRPTMSATTSKPPPATAEKGTSQR